MLRPSNALDFVRFPRRNTHPRSSRSKVRKNRPSRHLFFEQLEDRLVLDGVGPGVAQFRLLNDGGESATDQITTDPTVTGSVTGGNGSSFLRIEFDQNGDGTVDGSAGTGSDGNFVYRPEGLNVGSVAIRARAGRPEGADMQYVFGDWVSLNFTLQGVVNNGAPEIGTVALQYDTGVSASDGVTNDPTLSGTTTDDGSVFGLLVEFDHNADGIVDGSIRTDRNGHFTYTPANLPSGPSTISARAREWDAAQAAFLYGVWRPLAFTLDSTANTAPVVTELKLFRDTLASATDTITTDPRLTGTVSNDGRVQGLVVEFDRDANGVVDGTAYTGPTGQLWYLPKGLDTGTYTFRARAREALYGQTDPVFGPWTSLTFTLVDDPNNAVPQVTELVLREDTGLSNSDGITGDPRLRGIVTNDSDGFVKVQFDNNGDGASDAEEYTDLAGKFSYTPIGLPSGAVTIRARAAEWNEERFADVYGPWTSIAFTFDPSQNLPAVLSDVHLLYDTGVALGDGITSDATLTGSVTNDGSTANVVVEFDIDGDDRIDGSTVTDSAGKFTWLPQGLLNGENAIRVHTREWIPGQSPVVGAWTTVTFTLDPAANRAPVVASLTLFNDSGVSNSDRITRDPRLNGSVTDDGKLAGLVVQFDHDGDAIPDGSTRADAQGKFRYTPVGLIDGPITIFARAGEAGPSGTVSNLGAWVSLSFTLQNPLGNNPPDRVLDQTVTGHGPIKYRRDHHRSADSRVGHQQRKPKPVTRGIRP